MLEKGNYVLAIIKTTEEHNKIRDSLADLIDDMRNLDSINIDGETYDIVKKKFTPAGDGGSGR